VPFVAVELLYVKLQTIQQQQLWRCNQ